MDKTKLKLLPFLMILLITAQACEQKPAPVKVAVKAAVPAKKAVCCESNLPARFPSLARRTEVSLNKDLGKKSH